MEKLLVAELIVKRDGIHSGMKHMKMEDARHPSSTCLLGGDRISLQRRRYINDKTFSRTHAI